MSPMRFDPPHRFAPRSRPESPPPQTWRRDHQTASSGASSEDFTADGSTPSPCLSVVIPARNESRCLPQLVDEVVRALRPLCQRLDDTRSRRPGGFEIIIVDDGSTDPTAETLAGLARTIPELQPIRLRRNVGQSAAIAAGLRAASGYWIATLDADLQNDPADLVALWEALGGHDVALGWRVHRADVWLKRVISRVANQVRNTLLGQSIRDTGCSVRIFPRELALRLPWFHGAHRFIGPLLLREGCRIVQVPVNHRPRIHGQSHYNLRNRSLRVVVDLLGVAWLMNRPVVYELLARPVSRVSSPPQSSMRALPVDQRECQEVS